jgi:hypothetical protein
MTRVILLIIVFAAALTSAQVQMPKPLPPGPPPPPPAPTPTEPAQPAPARPSQPPLVARARAVLVTYSTWNGEDTGVERLRRAQLYVVKDAREWADFWSRFLPGSMPRGLDTSREMALVYSGPDDGRAPVIGSVFDEGDHLEVEIRSRACTGSCRAPWTIAVIPRRDVRVEVVLQ